MPTLKRPSKETLVKLLLIGDSGSGKTGALVSLVKAGYKLRIIDADDKLEGGILPRLLTDAEIATVQYVSLRDKVKGGATGPVFDGIPNTLTMISKLMDKWEDGTEPAKWGPEYILVIDSMTFMANAGFNWHKSLAPNVKEPRQWYYSAQGTVEMILSQVTDQERFRTNVIIISHITYVQMIEGVMKGFPSSIGKSQGPKIPAFFEHMAVAERPGKGVGTISFVPTAFIAAKTPVLSVDKLPADQALAKFFEAAKK